MLNELNHVKIRELENHQNKINLHPVHELKFVSKLKRISKIASIIHPLPMSHPMSQKSFNKTIGLPTRQWLIVIIFIIASFTIGGRIFVHNSCGSIESD
jgi:hypothetical protein